MEGRTTYTVYDRSGNLLMESDDQDNVLREFVYLNGTWISLLDYTASLDMLILETGIRLTCCMHDGGKYGGNKQISN